MCVYLEIMNERDLFKRQPALDAQTQEWNRAAEKLGIQWPITYSIRQDIDTCQVVSHPDERRHDISLVPEVLTKSELFEVDVMHEICHAKISEAVDPAFSTIRFSRAAQEEWDGAREEEFSRNARQLYLAWAHEDVWINDLRHEHWPLLTKKDITSSHAGLRTMVTQGDAQTLQQPRTYMAFALNIAEANRRLPKKDRPDPLPILRAYDMPSRSLINTLAAHIAKLPKLPQDRQAAGRLLEGSVQEVTRILKLSIKPRLIEEDGALVWDM